MTNPHTFPGGHPPFPPGVPYPRPEEMYSPYSWPTTPFPGGFGLPPGPNYDDNPAWAQFRQAMAHPASTPIVPDAARKRTDELLERLSEERRELLARFPPLTPSSVGSHLRRSSSNGFATPLPNRMEAPAVRGYPPGGIRQSTGQVLNAIPEEDARTQAVIREMPSFGGGRAGMEARSPEDRAVAARRYSNAFADRSPARRSTIDNFLHNVGERGPRRSLSAEGRVEGQVEDKENDNSMNSNAGGVYSQHLDQTAQFGAMTKEARTVSPSTRRRSSMIIRPLISRGTGNSDIRDVHSMCCDACPCKGGKPLCCENCSLKGHMEGGKREMKETACNTEWEEGIQVEDNGGLPGAVPGGIMRRKRPRHSSPVDGSDKMAEEEEDICQHIGPWHGKVPPKPSAPKDLRVPERLSKVDRRRGERARRKNKTATTAPYEPQQQPQLNQSSQISNGSAFQSLVEEAEEATAAAAAAAVAAEYRERIHPEREHGRNLHEGRARQRAREHREKHRKAERGVPRRGGSLSSNEDLEANPLSVIEESYDNRQAEFEAQEIQRTERRRYSEARRQDQAGLIRTGRVDEHRGVNRGGGSFDEDPDETARHLSFDDPSFDAIPEEPDNITYQSEDDETLSAIHPSVDGHRASETVSFGRQQREGVKMVNTSLQVGPELVSPVKAPGKRKTRSRKHRDPESSDGTLVEEFRESPSYGRGAPRSTRRPPLDVMKGEKILYKRTNSGHGFVIGTLTRHKHDKERGTTSRESRSSDGHVPSRERSRGNRASLESYDPNQSLLPTNSLTYDEVSGLFSEKSPPPPPGRKKGAAGDKKGKKKGTVSRSKAPQAKAKSRAARKKTGVINAKKGAQRVAAAKGASKNSGEGRRSQDRKGGSSSERRVAPGEVPHAHREGGPRHTYALPGENWWRSDGSDSAIPADYKLVGYREDRLLEYHSNMKCLVPLDSPQFMPVLLQLSPYQQKIPETVSDGKSVYFFILECGEGASNAVDEYPIMVHYENKQRLLGTGDSFVVGPGITYSIENEHATRDAKILMLLRHDTLENSGLNSEIEA